MRFKIRVKDNATPYLIKGIKQNLETIEQRLVRAGGLLYDQMHNSLIPSPNYSLKQLRKMGHPYALKRYYTNKGTDNYGIRDNSPIAGTPSSRVHDPYWMVNRQTAQMSRDLKTVGPISMPAFSASKRQLRSMPQTIVMQIGIPDDAPSREYAGYVVYGTETMVPRNFIGKTLDQNKEAIAAILLGRV